ncbi:putative COX4-cytochrome-c oxidase chain IV [Serendipita vermifera]|nr:putative COX4-cytochrome-c oxidase chain IV [Serendipita vermifera]
MLGARVVRSLRTTLPKFQRTIISKQATRSIASSSKLRSEAPPTLYGEGAKAGEVPTDFQQSTGLERLQLLGQMEGVDVFNMGPLVMTKAGTTAEPTIVPSYSEERIVGCSGWPLESHDTIWITMNNHKEHHRCPECGNVFKMHFLGEAGGHHHH